MQGKRTMVESSNLIRDVLIFIRDDLIKNIDDPITGYRSSNSRFVATSYPQRVVEYPMITILMTNQEAFRAGMQTAKMDIILTLEIRIWARNQKEKDKIFTEVFERLRNIQFSTNIGSIDNNLHDFALLSATEVDEPGEGGVKSRIGQIQYKFYNI